MDEETKPLSRLGREALGGVRGPGTRSAVGRTGPRAPPLWTPDAPPGPVLISRTRGVPVDSCGDTSRNATGGVLALTTHATLL